MLQVYAVHFKCNKRLLREYPNIFNYIKDVYQINRMSSTVKMDHIKQHYYGSHPKLNPFGIIPHGPNIDYSSPHDRDRFSSWKDQISMFITCPKNNILQRNMFLYFNFKVNNTYVCVCCKLCYVWILQIDLYVPRLVLKTSNTCVCVPQVNNALISWPFTLYDVTTFVEACWKQPTVQEQRNGIMCTAIYSTISQCVQTLEV